MKLKYDAEKGSRFKRTHFVGVESGSHKYRWYSRDRKRWVDDPQFEKEELTYLAPCGSVKAFKRMLRKNPGIIGRATLVCRYLGYDIHG